MLDEARDVGITKEAEEEEVIVGESLDTKRFHSFRAATSGIGSVLGPPLFSSLLAASSAKLHN